MARYYSHGSKLYSLEDGIYQELGDAFGDGIGWGKGWISDGEPDSTFQVGDTFDVRSEYIGRIAVPLASGGSEVMPVFQFIAQPDVIWIESSIFPLDRDLQFPDILNITELVRKPFVVQTGPTPLDDNFDGIDGPENVSLDTGNDVFRGGGGGDLVYGDEGHDRIFGQRGNDELFGGEGRDKLGGGTGNDKIYGGKSADRLKGGQGNDTLDGDSGRDKLWGEDGNDTIAGGSDSDRLRGGLGSDTLDGETGNDKIWGGRGNDVFNDSAGNDVMRGGPGSDTFIFNVSAYRWFYHGADKIHDFDEARDRLNIFVENPEEVEVSHASGNTIIRYDAGTVVLVNVHVDADSDAFLFA